VISWRRGNELEPLQEEASNFDVFHFYLKELLDAADEMEKSPKKDAAAH